MGRKLALIFVLSFLLNLVWEQMHAGLYLNYRGGQITQLILFRATLFDAVFTTILGAIFLRNKTLQNRLWLTLPIGILVAVVIEIYALQTGRWAYNPSMPIVPLLGAGLTPTLQLGILSYLTLKIVNHD